MSAPISRRTFLAETGLALTAASFAGPSGAARGRLFAYVGRNPGFASMGMANPFMPPSGGGIDVFRVNMSDGSLQKVGSTGPEAAGLYCDGMCTSADGRFLYALNTTAALRGVQGAGGGVDAFAINRADGSLQHLGTWASMGANPAAVRIDKTNSRVIVANHGAVNKVCLVVKKDGVPVIESPTDSATVALFPVQADGSLGAVADVGVFTEPPSGHPGIIPGPACHSAVFDRTQRWIIATDNGYDHIYVYPFSPSSRAMQGKAYPTPPGRAPRHIVVHPRAPYFYITNEFEPTVSAFHFDSDTGEPSLIQTIATVAGVDTEAPKKLGGFTIPTKLPEDIRLHPNGKFLYASTRLSPMSGNVSMATFAVDTHTGQLTRIDVVDAAGKGQREFNIEPSGKFLFGCNATSNDVAAYALDPHTGKMTQAATTSNVSHGAVIDFAML